MKQNKKGKIRFVIYVAGFFFKKKFCYEVIVKQKIYKRSTNHYSRPDGEVSGTEGERLLSHTQGEKGRDREPLPNTHTHTYTHTHTHTHTHQSLAGLLLLAEEVLELEPKQ